jgi:replication factor A1
MKLLRHKRSIGEYLAFLSVKYQVDPDKLLDALRLARERKESNCDHLSIECRGKINATQIFLIRNDSRVVAQFRVFEDFLLESGNSLRKFMDTDMVRKHLSKKKKSVHSHFITDLRSGMNHVNLTAKILEVAEPRRVVTRYGNYANVAKALIADETGTIKLCLWNEQINSVSVGDMVQIGNAKTSMFRGERQLTLGMKGVLNSAEGVESRMAQPVCPSNLKT